MLAIIKVKNGYMVPKEGHLYDTPYEELLVFESKEGLARHFKINIEDISNAFEE